MADLFKKKNAELAEAPVAADANAPEMAPAEKKAKKEKKNKQQFLEPNKMNFKEQYEIVVEGKKKNLDLAKILKPLVAILVVVIAIFVVLEVVLIGMKAQTKSLNNYITDETNVASYNQALDLKSQIETVNAFKANTEDLMNAINSYPNIGTDFYATVKKAGTDNAVEVTAYSYSNLTGYLSITCVATDVNNVSKFVRSIKDCGLFDSVTYTGFDGTAELGYSFQVSCVCLGDANVVAPEAAPEVVEETTEVVE